jgi:hypothetical protein
MKADNTNLQHPRDNYKSFPITDRTQMKVGDVVVMHMPSAPYAPPVTVRILTPRGLAMVEKSQTELCWPVEPEYLNALRESFEPTMSVDGRQLTYGDVLYFDKLPFSGGHYHAANHGIS